MLSAVRLSPTANWLVPFKNTAHVYHCDCLALSFLNLAVNTLVCQLAYSFYCLICFNFLSAKFSFVLVANSTLSWCNFDYELITLKSLTVNTIQWRFIPFSMHRFWNMFVFYWEAGLFGRLGIVPVVVRDRWHSLVIVYVIPRVPKAITEHSNSFACFELSYFTDRLIWSNIV